MSKTRHGLCIFVENEFGVIQRVTNLFSARGMNIDTIHTTPIDSVANVSQISISLMETEKNIELIQKLLMRLLIVHEVHHIEIPIVENQPYISQVFKVQNEFISQVKKVLEQYEVTCFNVYSNTKIHCITGTQKVVSALTKHLSEIQSFVVAKEYSVF